MSEQSPAQVKMLGTPISIISIECALSRFEQWVRTSGDRCVVLRDVHGVMLARRHAQLNKAHQQSDLVAPDGMPIVWAARLAGFGNIGRVCGPDLLLAVCEHGLSRGWKHYFFGGKPGVAEKMAEELAKKLPGLKIAGTQSPPFRQLSEEEDDVVCESIRATRADFVWVGLGTPKQEVWMLEHRGKCGGAIMLGVGAAFDFYAGLVPRAPKWMQKYGLEWAYRFLQEPRRLWKRYLLFAPMFVILESLELIRNRILRPRVRG